MESDGVQAAVVGGGFGLVCRRFRLPLWGDCPVPREGVSLASVAVGGTCVFRCPAPAFGGRWIVLKRTSIRRCGRSIPAVVVASCRQSGLGLVVPGDFPVFPV